MNAAFSAPAAEVRTRHRAEESPAVEHAACFPSSNRNAFSDHRSGPGAVVVCSLALAARKRLVVSMQHGHQGAA